MGVEIARGEINIGLNDRDALNGLNRLRAEYAAKMAEIDRMEADVTLGANTQELDRKLKEAKDKVRILRGEKAEVKIGADSSELDAEIAQAEALVKRLDGKKARIEIETRGMETALAQEEALRKLEAKRASEENRFARQRLAMAQQESRSRASLERQRVSEMRNAERSAYRENEQRRMAGVNAAKEVREVARLQQEYAKLTDKLENLHRKQGRTFGKEARAKLELDTTGVVAHMEEIKAKLNVLGKHPPVNIRVDTDQGFFKNQLFGLRKTAEGFLNKFSEGFGKAKVNIGPLSISLRALGVGLATLGPLVTDLGGALVGLVGVLGTGLAGAGAVGAGILSGLILNFGGVFAAVKPIATEFKTATQATAAYNKAVLQYGKNSKEAKTAQEKMNSVLKGVDPNVRRAAIGAAHLGSEWRKLTHETASRNIGTILGEGVKTLDALLPTLAKNTNQTFDILGHRVGGMLRDLRTPGAIKIFDSLGKSANNFLNPALRGLEHLGAAFGHIAESAGRLFAGPAGRGFNRWAADIDRATQPGAKLDAEIRKMGRNASELLHFFAALGHVMVDVFNGGSRSGERMVVSMTNALNRWDEFLRSAQGRQSMADFFTRAEGGARALWGAIGPLISAFVQWSSLLSPFTAGLLQGIGFVSKLVLGFTKLVGLGGPLAVLGATLGTIFAVSKLAAFVGMLARVVTLMREAAAAGSVIGGAKTFFGGIGGALRGGSQFTAGGAAAGAEIRAAMVEGGTAAAAEIRGAMIAGGAAGAAETGVAEAGGAAALARGGVAAEGTAAGMVGLSAATLGVGAALAAVTGAVLYFHGKAAELNGTIKSLLASDDAMNKGIHDTTNALNDASPAALSAAQAHLSLREAQKEYNKYAKAGKQHTDEGRQALINLRQAEYDDVAAKKRLADSAGGITKGMREQLDVSKQSVDARKQELDTAQKRIDQDKKLGNALAPSLRAKDEQALADATSRYREALELQTQAQTRARVADLERQRALALLPPLTDRATLALQHLARAQGGSGRISQAVALNFKNPAKVATAATSALQAGVPRAAVLNVVANTHNARRALEELNALRLNPKDVQLRVKEGEALSKLARIDGIKLSAKTQRLLASGDADVIARIRKIVAQHTPPKNTKLTATDTATGLIRAVIGIAKGVPQKKSTLLTAVNQATNVIGAIITAIASIPTRKTTFIDVVRRGQAHNAEGGAHTPEEKRAFAAVDRAERAGGRRTRGGMYSRPTLLVGEENRTEYVIATNPAYRSTNEQYLAQAAAELGYSVEPAVTGKGKKKKKPPKKVGHHDKDSPNYAPRKKLHLMDSNSIRSDFIENYYSDAVGEYNKWTNKENSLGASLRQANNQYRDTPGDHAHDKQRRNLKRRIARMEAQWRTANRRRKKAKFDADRATDDYKRYAVDRNHIDEYTSLMNIDARKYNATGDEAALNDWTAKKGLREGSLKDVQDLLKRVKGYKSAKKFASDLNKQLAAVGDDLNASENEDAPTAPDAPEAPTLDTFIKGLGRTSELAGDLRAESEAKLTADTTDDLSARKTLFDFYKSVYDAAKGAGMPDDVIGAAAEAAAGYMDTSDQLGDNASPDLQAQLDQANARLDLMTRTNAVNAAAVSAFGSSGDIGTGIFSNAYSAARYEAGGMPMPTPSAPAGSPDTSGVSNGPTIIVQTLHPADPATLDAIGQAATAGLSLQGSVNTSQLVTGY